MHTELDPRNDPEQALSHRIHSREVYYRGQIIIEQGTLANRAFYIESGKVEISVCEGQHCLIVATLGAGEVVGEMALIEHSVRSATVRAVEDTVVTEISQAWLEAKIRASEDRVVRALLDLFVKRLREANQGQLQLYRNLAEFQDRIAGLSDKAADTHLDQAKRDRFRKDVEPLLNALDDVLLKYRQ